MTSSAKPSHPVASTRQRTRLTHAREPITDALAQDYAAWRGKVLRRVLVYTVLQYALTFLGETAWPDDATADPGAGEEQDAVEDVPKHPYLAKMLGGYLVLTGGVTFGLIAWAAWQWPNLRRSRRLARWAWAAFFFSPLFMFAIPPSWIVADPRQWVWTSLEQIRAILTFYGPGLFAFLPAVMRSAVMLKRFLPESQLPGVIGMLAAPFCAALYLLMLVVCIQLTVNPALICGLALLTTGPLVFLTFGSALLVRDSGPETRRTVRRLSRWQTTLTAAGVLLIAYYAAEFPLLKQLMGKVNPLWFLGFMAGVSASRMLLVVVLTDFLLQLLHRSREAARKLAGTPEGAVMDQKIGALGEALG